MPKKSGSKTRTKSKLNKSAWVRALPNALSAKDVIAKGKAAGIKLSKAQVYTIRANARRARAKAPVGRPGRPAGGARSSGRRAAPQRVGLAQRFASLAVDLGLGRAEALMVRLRARLSRVLAE